VYTLVVYNKGGTDAFPPFFFLPHHHHHQHTTTMAQFIQDTLAKVPGVDPRPLQRSQFFSGMNEGPAATASRIAGLVSSAEAQDNSPYYTSNFGQLLPDSGHPLNVGGIPYQGDALLLEKQQAFDRSKLAERIVHPCGWGAFGRCESE
jgi:catalase